MTNDFIAGDDQTTVDLSTIPEGWFLLRMKHRHTDVVYAGDKHNPVTREKHGIEPWLVELQHYDGGRMQSGTGASPVAALNDAIDLIHKWNAHFKGSKDAGSQS